MKTNFMPKTRLSKWAAGMGVALAALTAISLLFAFAIGGDPAIIDASPLLSMLAATISIMFSLAGLLSFFLELLPSPKTKTGRFANLWQYRILSPL